MISYMKKNYAYTITQAWLGLAFEEGPRLELGSGLNLKAWALLGFIISGLDPSLTTLLSNSTEPLHSALLCNITFSDVSKPKPR